MGSSKEPESFDYPTERLLHPECFSEQQLVDILKRRGVSAYNLLKDHRKLLDLYNRLALPLSKRIHNVSTKTGESLQKNQLKYPSSDTSEFNASNKNVSLKCHQNSSKRRAGDGVLPNSSGQPARKKTKWTPVHWP